MGGWQVGLDGQLAGSVGRLFVGWNVSRKGRIEWLANMTETLFYGSSSFVHGFILETSLHAGCIDVEGSLCSKLHI